MQFEKFFRNKRVLVTGADGFIGSHLSERLISYGAKVSVFVMRNCLIGAGNPRFRNITYLMPKFDSIIAGDIGSDDATDSIRKIRPEIVFHLAAEAYVNRSFSQPRGVIRTNVTGTVNTLHAFLDENMKPDNVVERIVVTSSSEIYGHHDDPIDESFELNPSSPYGASKAAADRLAYSYYNTYGLPIAIIRPFNTYGPRHTYDAPPKFILLALEGKDLPIYGDGAQTRDFTYVDDMINAFLTMGTHENAIGEAVNFGSGRDVSVLELAKTIITLAGSKSKIVHQHPRLSEVKRLCCNPSKAKKLFGWEPAISIEEGLRKNIKYEQGVRKALSSPVAEGLTSLASGNGI